MIMDSLDTMLSDAVSISALLSYDTKYIKFRQLKKQMSNISTPSPAASPEPQSDIISMDSVIESSVLVNLKNIESIEQEGSRIHTDPSESLETPVTIGAEFFPSTVSTSTASLPSLVSASPQLVDLAPVGENFASFEYLLLDQVPAFAPGVVHS